MVLQLIHTLSGNFLLSCIISTHVTEYCAVIGPALYSAGLRTNNSYISKQPIATLIITFHSMHVIDLQHTTYCCKGSYQTLKFPLSQIGVCLHRTMPVALGE